ncbi:alpha/beta hydrolase [Acutalibacter caecimuris]|uniref:alpha/beta hydrolase n=1 Tax=Acutalibacter caecimuris TaxID=3093657 RepID=UPI002AC9EB57|nr:alpha/beta hydrolase [Acutalibacter sp. M00118]
MKIVRFHPTTDTEASVVGYLHSPMGEMEQQRERFPAIIICPGGGYQWIADRVSDPVALPFFARGYQTFILSYSVGENARGLRPLRELAETVRALRDNSVWQVDPGKVALCGFSAGGHLAASLATLWDSPAIQGHLEIQDDCYRPNALLLGYPVITAEEFGHVPSIETVSGCKKGEPGYEFFSMEQHVTSKTCPTFLWHTAADELVPAENSLRFAEALQQAGVPYELHIFPNGGHGASVCTQEVGHLDPHTGQWLGLALNWLDREFGFRQ